MRQRTFSMIKPDAVSARYTGAILAALEGEGFRIEAMHMRTLTTTFARNFYREHVEKPFFDDLITFMTSGPSVLLCLSCEKGECLDIVAAVRGVIGATNPAKAEPGTIRFLYGSAINRNAIHASDSAEAAARELMMAGF